MDKGSSLRSLKYYFVLPAFYLYHGIKPVWPASWLKSVKQFRLNSAFLFTELLVQSVCEQAWTAAWRNSLGETKQEWQCVVWEELLCSGCDLLRVHTEKQTDTLVVSLVSLFQEK